MSGVPVLLARNSAASHSVFRSKKVQAVFSNCDQDMELTLILGPMKSGKSLELIGYFAPLEYTDLKFGLFQSARNVRDEYVQSRHGIKIQAKKINSLFDILPECPKDIVGIDEVHMFKETDAPAIRELLDKNVKIVASGLDTDYRGKLFKIITRLLELGPKEIKYKRAVCDTCRHPSAIYTQILQNMKPVVEGLPPVVPDDGSYAYRSACRQCFARK